MSGRDETIQRIRRALKRRTGHLWSVTGGRGTAWGWINVSTPPGHQRKHGRPDRMSPGEGIALARIVGHERPIHCRGWSIPASSKHYQWAVACAETGNGGPEPPPYWD